jgi:hypothetical protein
METFQLTRKQVKQLSDIAEHFSEINVFTLEQTHESGIGPTVVVKFDLFNNNPKSKDTTVDITDVESW